MLCPKPKWLSITLILLLSLQFGQGFMGTACLCCMCQLWWLYWDRKVCFQDDLFTWLVNWWWLSVLRMDLFMEQNTLPHSPPSRFQSKCSKSQEVETDIFLRPEPRNWHSITSAVFYWSASRSRWRGQRPQLSVSINTFYRHVFKLPQASSIKLWWRTT